MPRLFAHDHRNHQAARQERGRQEHGDAPVCEQNVHPRYRKRTEGEPDRGRQLDKKKAAVLCAKPVPEAGVPRCITVEIDGMWHYLRKKCRKLWIWKVYCRATGRLIDWECGDRDAATFRRLLERIRAWNPLFFCTDYYEVYRQTLPENRLKQGKDKTFRVEQNNGRQRHYFARFNRKSICVSRSLQMVEATIAIFAAFHVNKTVTFS